MRSPRFLQRVIFAGATSISVCNSPSTELPVEFAGCKLVLGSGSSDPAHASPICEVGPDTTLTFWIDGEATSEIEVDLPVRSSTVASTRMDRGWQFSVGNLGTANSITVSANFHDVRRFFTLALAPNQISEAVDEADRVRWTQTATVARRRIEGAIASASSLRDRARLTGILARIAKTEQADDTVELFRRAIALDGEARLISCEVFDRLVLSLVYLDRGELSRARETLEDARAPLSFFPQGRAMEPYYRSLLHAQLGDLQEALNALNDSDLKSTRLALAGHLVDVPQRTAIVLATLGRYEEAFKKIDAVSERLSDRPISARAKVQLLINQAWIALLVPEGGSGLLGLPYRDPVAPLEEARAILRAPGPVDADALTNIEINLALAALRDGRLDDASAHVENSRRIESKSRDDERAYVDGEIALLRSQPELALEIFEHIGGDLLVHAVSGKAKALEQLGRIEEARTAHRRADEWLDGWSLMTPIGQGRSLLLERHITIPGQRIDFLLRQAESAADPRPWLAEAADAARTANNRVLRTLSVVRREEAEQYHQKREDIFRRMKEAQELPVNETRRELERLTEELQALAETFAKNSEPVRRPAVLRRPLPNEVLLVYHPVPSGWIGFAITDSAVFAKRLAAPKSARTREEQSKLFLEPFAGVLEKVGRVRLGASGLLQEIDFENLPWKGRTLLATLPVARSFDVLIVPDARAIATRALIVGDPTQDLPAARIEATFVALTVAPFFPSPGLLLGDEARHKSVRTALGREDLAIFHYAGHGTHRGGDGWLSELELSDGSLNIPDIISLSKVPRVVILSSCSSGTTDLTTAVGLGVAQAFIVRGTNFVLAPTEKIDDESARKLIETLYQDPKVLLRDPVAALHAVVSRNPELEKAGFRALIP